MAARSSSAKPAEPKVDDTPAEVPAEPKVDETPAEVPAEPKVDETPAEVPAEPKVDETPADGEVTVKVAAAISGTRNGLPWPAIGEPITLPAAEAASYIQFGYVVPIED